MSDTPPTSGRPVGDEVVVSHPFAVRIDHHDGAVLVRLAGALEGPGLHALRARLWPLIARYDATMVTFDGAGLERIDPDGVRLLGQFARAIAPGRPVLRGLVPPVLRCVVDGGLSRWFEIDRAGDVDGRSATSGRRAAR